MTLEELIRKKHSDDEEQLKFVFSEEKKIIVTAPAGCGKTTAMVSKIARELSAGHIPAHKKVLAMTFSVNAAMKIKDSLKILLPELVSNAEKYISKVDIANYHNFAMRLLFKHGYILNLEFSNLSEFKVVDENSNLINQYITSNESTKLKALDDAVKKSSKDDLKNSLEDYWSILNGKLISNRILTYNGILIAAIKLLCKKPVVAFYKEYYQMLIIDEFQDTNLLGYLLIKKLIGDNIVILLGDDVQKIYGFLGAVNGIFEMFMNSYPMLEIVFQNNYRFRTNERMKELDLLIRDYAENYSSSELEAKILLKKCNTDEEEDEFVVRGINRIITYTKDKVAVLVRASWQADVIAYKLGEQGIKYFNALFGEADDECLNFYAIALEEFHKATSGRAIQKDLKKSLQAVKNRKHEIYFEDKKKYIYDSLIKLLEVLFEESKKWEGTSKEKYENIDFILANNGLKRMMEFIDESVILTSIHSAKGLEWEYVIIPRLNGYAFPNSHMCRPCQDVHSCRSGFDYCEFLYDQTMEKAFKEEISVLYVAVTRAKKDVFMVVNTGLNKWNHNKRTSCLLNLEGISAEEYEWNDIFK